MNEQPLEGRDEKTSVASPHRSNVVTTFGFAVSGIVYLLRSQRNARLHLLAASAACALAWWLSLDRIGWAILVATIASIFTLEGLNTAIEAVVDLASPDIHPLAKIAKDVAAGMVLIAAVAAAIIGAILFLPLLAQRLHR